MPNEAGIEPDMLVVDRFRNCREESEESCVGSDERFRNVFGSDSEITLCVGEHVMPFHEQGVDEDRSQDDNTDDDNDGDDGDGDSNDSNA